MNKIKAWIVIYDKELDEGFCVGGIYLTRKVARKERDAFRGFDLDNVRIKKCEIKILNL